jgi:hypothetical protein
MDKKITIALLKRRLDYIPRLKKLPPENGEFPDWDERVKKLLEITFGDTSDEYVMYDTISRPEKVSGQTPEETQEAYIDSLNQREKTLKAIIAGQEIPAGEEKPATVNQNTVYQKNHDYKNFWYWIGAHKIIGAMSILGAVAVAAIVVGIVTS